MRLNIEHRTTYRFSEPKFFGLQELRQTPKSRAGQLVLRWNIAVEGGVVEARFDDQHNNQVTLISLHEGVDALEIVCDGEVETADAAGVVGRHGGFAPLWIFERPTALTEPGPKLRRLAGGIGDDFASDIDRLHALSHAVAAAAPYRVGATGVEHTAEGALAAKGGVCQDHAHIFCAVARLLGFPARYVSGYLLMDDRTEQDATHAWAEAHVADLGWVGFDVSNGISPDARYVRVATGLDYLDAAPVSGMTFGPGDENLEVGIRVAQAL